MPCSSIFISVTVFLSVALSRPAAALERSPDVNGVAVFQTVCKSVGSGMTNKSITIQAVKSQNKPAGCWVLGAASSSVPPFVFPFAYTYTWCHVYPFSITVSVGSYGAYRAMRTVPGAFVLFHRLRFCLRFFFGLSLRGCSCWVAFNRNTACRTACMCC